MVNLHLESTDGLIYKMSCDLSTCYLQVEAD